MTPNDVIAAMTPATVAAPTPEEAAVLAALPKHSEGRAESLLLALRLGADAPTLVGLARARRLHRGPDIVLPGRYAHTSRAGGWARLGRGTSAQWGVQESKGWRVTLPGRWTVLSTDGFSRKEQVDWDVEHVQVGAETWTTAD